MTEQKKEEIYNEKLQQIMENAIERLNKMIHDSETPHYVKAKAAATLGKLIGQYLDIFDVPEETKTHLRSVKDF